jgi:glycosyltransferase involved in cell wall biosynthesis
MPDPIQPDVILIPVHNRCTTTVDVLRLLESDDVFAWATVLVIDDGSTDGTSDAIRRGFPAVELLHGDGNWWWGGAIRRGMEWALERGAERIFWLNDDCRPPAGGMKALRDAIATEGGVAWIDARTPAGWTYGAHRRTAWGVRRCTPAEERAGKTETFNGNCVGLPRSWIERVGLPHDRDFPHSAADFDYGLRLHAAGARLRAVSGITADSAEPARAAAEAWLASERPMREIWRDFSSPRSYLHFSTWRNFCRRHWGWGWGWCVFAAPYVRWAGIAVLRTLFPGLARVVARRRTRRS